MTEQIKKTKIFLLDLDGTVYIDDNLIGDVKETLSILRARGAKIGYLTNNSSRTNDEYREKLGRMGLYRPQDGDFIYTSLDVAADVLNDEYAGRSVYVLATEKCRRFLSEAGVNVVSDENYKDANVVLLCFDKELTYDKLVKANELIVKGATYLATHPDLTCPTDDVFIPDTGSFIKLLEASSGKLPRVLGKPFSEMAERIEAKYNVSQKEITMVGDRLTTDIAFGVNSRLNTILVLSGETDKKTAEASEIKADLVLPDINAVIDVR